MYISTSISPPDNTISHAALLPKDTTLGDSRRLCERCKEKGKETKIEKGARSDVVNGSDCRKKDRERKKK
jgi:hypothetical protein